MNREKKVFFYWLKMLQIQNHPTLVFSLFNVWFLPSLCKVLDPEKQADLLDSLRICLLQFSTLLVEHAPHHIHDNNKSRNSKLRRLMTFAWPCLLPKACVDPACKYSGHLLLAHIIAKFAIHKKIVLQVRTCRTSKTNCHYKTTFFFADLFSIKVTELNGIPLIYVCFHFHRSSTACSRPIQWKPGPLYGRPWPSWLQLCLPAWKTGTRC